jgi:predicted GIY-YIG superfamily endonuclease
MNIPSIELQIQTLPDNPGVYQYYDKEGKILYVGKAKNLKKRVSSYFNKQHDNAKTNVLVRKIVEIKHIVVSSEQDALLLENNLIKKLQPRYNVLLRDDKTYPWICIKREPFPRIFPTRRMTKDGSEYFGPYTNFKTVNTILDLIKEFNHSHSKPMLAVNLGAGNWFTTNVKFPNVNHNYTLLIDFLNLNDDGKEISVEVIHSDSKIQQGRVFLYKCNLTYVILLL